METDLNICVCVHMYMYIYVVWNRETETCVSVCIGMQVCGIKYTETCVSVYLHMHMCVLWNRETDNVCLHAYLACICMHVCVVWNRLRHIYLCVCMSMCVIWNRKRQKREKTRWWKPDLLRSVHVFIWTRESCSTWTALMGFSLALSSLYYIIKLAASAF